MTTATIDTFRPHRSSPARRPVRRAARLTRRGRAVLVLTVLALLVVAGMTLGYGSGRGAGRPTGLRHVTVQSGETLWGVAARIDPHQDPRLVVAKLEAANGLSGPTVLAGQQLVLPPIG
jgi:hypothetical protein